MPEGSGNKPRITSCAVGIGHVTQIEWGQRPAYLASLRDITERKQLEQELRQHKTRYHTILQDQTEMICRFQPDGTLSFVNDAYCRYFQKSRQELLGSNFISVVRPDNRVIFFIDLALFLRHDLQPVLHAILQLSCLPARACRLFPRLIAAL